MPKKSIEDEINEFLEVWDIDQLIKFFDDIYPLFVLYDVEEDNDWVKAAVDGGEEDVRTIRLIKTVQLVSRIADAHAGKLSLLKMRFRGLHKKLEEKARDEAKKLHT